MVTCAPYVGKRDRSRHGDWNATQFQRRTIATTKVILGRVSRSERAVANLPRETFYILFLFCFVLSYVPGVYLRFTSSTFLSRRFLMLSSSLSFCVFVQFWFFVIILHSKMVSLTRTEQRTHIRNKRALIS